ncbi:MAG: hypothetical protein JOZ73_07580 [Solirubrobacterales bacterium]|nr:hypothetical protein [Solirubrobacterales bacterium]
MRLGRVITPWILALTLVFCASAQAKIVVGKSIAGVTIGMTKTHVVALLGRGKVESRSGGTSVFTYRHGRYDVTYKHGRVIEILTDSKQERTSNGVGVGSTLSKVKKRVRHLHCVLQRFFYGCYVKSSHGHRWTLFIFDPSGSDRVTDIDLNNSGYM